MTYATWKHVKYLSEVAKNLDHTGQGGSTFTLRLQEYGKLGSSSAENLQSTSIQLKKAEQLTADFVIDDGVSNKGHRYNLFSKIYTKVGLGLFKGSNTV